MSNPYLDRLRTEFTQVTAGIDSVLERAVDAGRDLTDDENALIEREDEKREKLQKAIDVQVGLLERTTKVGNVLGGIRISAPTTVVNNGAPAEPEFDIAREIPTPGMYAHLLHKAVIRRDSEAIALLERVAAEQTTGDNAGLIPEPILGPVVDIVKARRRFVNSIGGSRSAVANKFNRPYVAQHVDVDAQAAELDELASQKMSITELPVALNTIGGYVNLSKQDVRWSQPGILDIMYQSFTKIYARRSNTKVCADFLTGCTQTEALDWSDFSTLATTRATLDTWLAGAEADLNEDASPDILWVSRDVAAVLRKVRNEMGSKAYNVPMGSNEGDVEGLRLVVDPHFAAQTLVLGDSEYVEVYEDLEGFLTVELPSMAGQQVGYAGYIDTLVTEVDAFSKAAVVA